MKLLGEAFDGTLITDDYTAYNAVGAKNQQTCWNHIRTKAKEVAQQIEVTAKTDPAPHSAEFCRKLQRFAGKACALGRQKKKRKLSLCKAKAKIPRLRSTRCCCASTMSNAATRRSRWGG